MANPIQRLLRLLAHPRSQSELEDAARELEVSRESLHSSMEVADLARSRMAHGEQTTAEDLLVDRVYLVLRGRQQ